ncbi:hypothetical protein MTQ01_02135 [Streptomyces sp. XM4193]|uniref:hypothetical protein n=1 Tax=Streptomyces sp. XM4193 TaxID=2929782 RepID=UPI001FF9393E|nr:hypothetical protein [Streptomyces sp. XM4193]MCK1794840.1 hypothetical protein [Streptomyces sp. XM4193]
MNIDHAHDAPLIVISARVCTGDGRRPVRRAPAAGVRLGPAEPAHVGPSDTARPHRAGRVRDGLVLGGLVRAGRKAAHRWHTRTAREAEL